MITSETVECPQCRAPLTLMPDRRFCQCTYCGAKFAVRLLDSGAPRLERVESATGTPAAEAMLLDAQKRLSDLEMTIADVEDEIESARGELADAESAYRQARSNVQVAISPMQNMTYVAGLLAVLAAFATLFVFKNPQRLPGAAIAVLLAVTTWAFHREWQETEGQALDVCQQARDAVTEAELEVHSASTRLEDARLERELLEKQILPGQADASLSGGDRDEA